MPKGTGKKGKDGDKNVRELLNMISLGQEVTIVDGGRFTGKFLGFTDGFVILALHGNKAVFLDSNDIEAVIV